MSNPAAGELMASPSPPQESAGVELTANPNSTNGVATGPAFLAPHPQSPTDNASVRIMLNEQGEGEGEDGVGELGLAQMRVLEKPNRLRQESELKRIRMMRGATTSPSMAGSMVGGANEIVPPHKPGKSVPTTSYNSPKDTLLACIKAGLAKSILPVRTSSTRTRKSARTFRAAGASVGQACATA